MGKVFVDTVWQASAVRADVKRRGGPAYCRMWAEDLVSLHELARRIGLSRDLFIATPGYQHYELSVENRRLALAFGAEEKPIAEWVRTRKPPPRPGKPLAGMLEP